MRYYLILALLASLHLAAQVITTSDAVIMRNGMVEFAVNRSDLSLRHLRDLRRQVEYVASPGGTLFSAAFGIFTADTWRTETDFSVNGFNVAEHRVEALREGNADVLKLHYLGGIVNDRGQTVDVCITVTLPDDSSLLTWNIAIDNPTGIPLKELRFPILDGLASSAAGSEQTDSVALPLFCGTISKNPRHALITGQEMSNYPRSSGLAFQMMYYDDGQGGGIYFAAHDDGDNFKTFACRPNGGSFRMDNLHYGATAPDRAVLKITDPFDNTTAFGHWELPYPVVTGLIFGDWYDACKLYRQWTLTCERWKPLAQRDDVSERFRSEVMAWFCLWGRPQHTIQAMVNGEPNTDAAFVQDCQKAMDEVVEKILRLQELLEVKVGVHLYMWYKSGEMDHKYPDYFPALPGVKEGIAALRAKGAAVMPYINVLLFDSSVPQFEEAKPYFSKSLDGNIVSPGMPGSGLYQGGGWGGMCFYTEWWQNYLTDVFRTLKDEYQCDAAYMDLLFNSQGFCFDKKHGHTIAGGDYYGKGARAMVGKVKALYPKGEAFIVGENTGETYIGQADALLIALPETEPTSVPMFETVYSDRTNMMGLYYGGDAQLCFELVRGRMFWLAGVPDMDNEAQMAMWRNVLKTRQAGVEFLYDGELLRTPDLSRVPHLKQQWDVFLKAQKVEFDIPAVFAEVYRSPAGAIGIVLANHTALDQSVSFPWNARDWGFPVGTPVKRSEYGAEKWSAAEDTLIAADFTMTVPAHCAVIVKLEADAPAAPLLGALTPDNRPRVGNPLSEGSDDARFNPDNPIYRPTGQ